MSKPLASAGGIDRKARKARKGVVDVGSFAVFALFAVDPSFRGSWQDEPVRIVCSAAREK